LFLSRALALRLAHAYGTRASKILSGVSSASDLGQLFGDTLTEREVRYLMTHEFARTAEDVVWRRSKLGLRLSAEEVKALDDWMTTHRDGAARPVMEAGGRT
jgi:glycerol-3-phosphate dehydrogenase